MIQATSPAARALHSKPHSFSLSKARQIVKDCFRPKPWVYWTDFIVSFGLGVFCFQRVRGGNLTVPHQGFTGELSQALYFVAHVLLFYRCGMFIHELVHQRNGSLRVFRIVWNLLCGIPFLTPTFVYYSHIDHHRRAHYGTHQDGEYLPLIDRGAGYMLYYLSWTFVIPLVAIFRFMFLTPIAWCVPGARAWIHQRASSLVMDPSYIRPLPSRAARRVIFWQELGCFAWCWGIVILPPLVLDRWALPFAIHAYLTGVCIVGLNSIRTLGSHRWSNSGSEMTFLDQLLDSVNYPHMPILSELWGPVGSRFHALHHLFPSMPYHEMAKAHRRLMSELPSDSPYRATVAPSLTQALNELWQSAKRSA